MNFEPIALQHETDPNHAPPVNVVALHCSLSNGRQWGKLKEEFGPSATVWSPDLAGYGVNVPFSDPCPYRLDTEVERITETLKPLSGPIHLVGHSYGGAVAFKLATSETFRNRVASMTLIEPVLPSVLLAQTSDRRLYDAFATEAAKICTSLWGYDRRSGLQRFLTFWNGPGSWEALSSEKRQAFLERVYKLTADFTAIFSEADVAGLAETLRVPTLLIAGTISPEPTRMIVKRLSSKLRNAKAMSVPTAGHMLAITHASQINPHIVEHIRAEVPAVANAC